MTNKMQRQQGFTLIELIIVIVILGILAATASPKFLNLQGDARASTVQGLAASLKSASNIVYSKALVQGKASASTATTTNPALNVVFGYPQATVADISAILEITVRTAANTDPAGVEWEIADSSGVVRVYPAGDYDGDAAFTNDEQCYVEYTQATSTAVATIDTVTSGC